MSQDGKKMISLCVPYFSLHLCQLDNNKGVYPTPYEFSLGKFSDFLKCYIFLCKVADHAASEAREVFIKWKTIRGREKLEEIARMASECPWQPDIPVTSAAPHEFIHFEDNIPWEDVEPVMDDLDWGSLEEDTGDESIVAGIA